MMSDGALSQDEIEALLKGADEAFGELENVSKGSDMSGSQKQIATDVARTIIENQGSSLSSITTKTSSVSFSNLTIGDSSTLKGLLSGKYIEAVVGYTGDLQGSIYYYLSEKDALAISTLMMGQEEAELTDMSAQVLSEAFSQMTGTANSAVTSKFSVNWSNNPVDSHILGDPNEIGLDGQIAVVEARLTVDGSIDSSPFIFAFDAAMLNSMTSALAPKQAPAASAAPAGGSAPAGKPAPSVGIQHADFGSLSEAADVQGTGNIGLLMDVTMNMTVELGRATMTIKNILSLGEGSIIKLQKLAGEPVDLLVNGKLIARGEVVVIDENFGVRVTDIVSSMAGLSNKPF